MTTLINISQPNIIEVAFTNGPTINVEVQNPILQDNINLSVQQNNAQIEVNNLPPITVEASVTHAVNGASAYQIAVANGFIGTEQEWLDEFIVPDVDLTAKYLIAKL